MLLTTVRADSALLSLTKSKLLANTRINSIFPINFTAFMSHPAKKAFFSSLAALCTLGFAWGQSTISFTNSATAQGNNSYVNISLGKFDTGLGTLTGVNVTINFVTLGGTFTISTPVDSFADVEFDAAAARVVVRGASNALGFTQYGETSFSVNTTPGPGTIVAGEGGSQQFIVNSTNVLTAQTRTIATNFWSAYESAGGSGTVNFQVKNRPDVSASGGDFTQSITPFTSLANMTVTYTYTGAEPIPEPSTVAAGAFLTMLAAASYWRRRQKSAPRIDQA